MTKILNEDKRIILEDIIDYVVNHQKTINRETDPDFYTDLGYLEAKIWEIWRKYLDI